MSWKDYDLFQPTEEHQMLRSMVAEFVQEEVEPQAEEFDRKEEFNLDLFKKLGDLGLLGITVPEEYGGAGLDALAAVIVHEELSSSDPGLCLAYLAHSILTANNLAINGGEELKKRVLPYLCSGEWVGCMAMSEPDAGTDVLAMRTEAQLVGQQYVINGRKMWITNGTLDEKKTPADCVLLYARTGEKDGRPLISTFLVEKGHKGYSVGQKIRGKTGMRASNTAELVFEQCEVPQENLIGEEGASLKHMMRNLEIERLTLAAMSLGIARRCLQVMSQYAKERKAFGKPISYFGQIQRHIGESYAEYQAARSYIYETARTYNMTASGQRLNSDGVKLFTSTVAKNIADRAIQVLGGYGYVSEYVVERLWRDSKLLEIGGGTVEAHQKNITRDFLKTL
ncbi:MAG: isovaleryl-CoA dehydrogenase [Bdellovibrio sp.]|nr:MAG: isovaleryl-CoA dehydrogenase [Bdellovibrio sp.]